MTYSAYVSGIVPAAKPAGNRGAIPFWHFASLFFDVAQRVFLEAFDPLFTAAKKPITLRNEQYKTGNPTKCEVWQTSQETLPFVVWFIVNFNPTFCTLFHCFVLVV